MQPCARPPSDALTREAVEYVEPGIPASAPPQLLGVDLAVHRRGEARGVVLHLAYILLTEAVQARRTIKSPRLVVQLIRYLVRVRVRVRLKDWRLRVKG